MDSTRLVKAAALWVAAILLAMLSGLLGYIGPLLGSARGVQWFVLHVAPWISVGWVAVLDIDFVRSIRRGVMTHSEVSAYRFFGFLVAQTAILGLQNDPMVWLPLVLCYLLVAVMLFHPTKGRVAQGTWDPVTGTHLDLKTGTRRRGSAR